MNTSLPFTQRRLAKTLLTDGVNHARPKANFVANLLMSVHSEADETPNQAMQRTANRLMPSFHCCVNVISNSCGR
jgi:hypothetical protein